ncbi:MAG TPA: TIM barrel protein [Solirubrobacteraceae bacterium]|jgi:sugar phosphate isomerase/epimerase|nr:TIM barrel protein [Solirubrobacteraceae bacterium]
MSEAPLLATCWLTAGDAAPKRGDERSQFALRDRIEAAAAAGFGAFGFAHPDLAPAVDRYGMQGIRSMLEDNGLAYLELEFIGDWWSDGSARARSDVVRRDLLLAAEELGAHHIKVGVDMADGPWAFDHWVAEFAALAEEARQSGTLVALEPMPFGNIKTVAEALRLVEAAGHEAGGLLVDIWHVARANTPFDQLAALPADRIFGVELDDAAPAPVGSLWEDTVNHRRFCGDGVLDIPAFINALERAGWSGPWGVEVVSDQLRAMSLSDAVATAHRTTQRQFDAALRPAR